MVYDLTEAASVDDLENYWITEAYNYCDKSIKVLLLGNKCDAERNVNPEVEIGLFRGLRKWQRKMDILLRKSVRRLAKRLMILSRSSVLRSPRQRWKRWEFHGRQVAHSTLPPNPQPPRPLPPRNNSQSSRRSNKSSPQNRPSKQFNPCN